MRPRWATATAACLAAAVLIQACARDADPPAGPQASADRYLKPDTEEVRGVVPPNANLGGLLRQHLNEQAAVGAVDVISAAFDPRRLRASQLYTITRTLAGGLRGFRYEIDADRYLRVEPASALAPADLRAAVVAYARTEAVAGLAGDIDAAAPSLFESVDRAGGGEDLAVELANVFSGEIDFNSELQPGDHYRVAVDKITRETGTVSYGVIHAAEFFNDGRRLRAIRFVAPDGAAGYYDEQGRSLKRFFLKSPLKFEPRITSRFSYSRRHPVLNVTRAHLGVDYAAPVGALVIAVSHGVVTRAGFAGQAGRLVAIRHTSGYETQYLHLSRIHVKPGQRVSQGDVIGLVGSSGLSTGPHLDYRVKKDGKYVNPVTVHRSMPPGEPIPAAHLAAFMAGKDKALALLPAAPAAAAGGPPPAAPPPAAGATSR